MSWKVVTTRQIPISMLLVTNIQTPRLGGRPPRSSTYTPCVPQLLPCDPPQGQLSRNEGWLSPPYRPTLAPEAHSQVLPRNQRTSRYNVPVLPSTGRRNGNSWSQGDLRDAVDQVGSFDEKAWFVDDSRCFQPLAEGNQPTTRYSSRPA